ncbi:MAG: DUF4870 domain-containing protein [Anaerolineae bacterium]|nr:DUF4870 domain-containing protein [Anaerolineae bacterium]
MKEASKEMSANGKAANGEMVEVPTAEWTTASLAHASILLTVLFGLAGGIGLPFGLAVPLVMYLGYRKQSRYVAFHAMQAFVYQLAGALTLALLGALVTMAWSVSGSLAAVLVGLALMPFALSLTLLLASAAIAWVVYGLYAAYHVYQGRNLRYWLIGERLEREVKL